ncbi:two component transcriptional regulator, LytTR family [Solimonas aquatica]|uniref:Two component transcriptional regulator, LytTR family n=1 Tax=Solimonas aquatica TaxID=489703 RepID=A0A1H9GRQ1_9GAMM|nr:LytTR family DNA-binding domain-containing protein [Solimonas aquatica]SEQ52720.1 two component transcriptional regulator, LytTR family [Solimonas aquatica]
MRVVIVDDEPLARERLKRLLQEFPGYEVVGEASDGESALDVIDDEEPDLVLLDIRMGGMDGLQVGRQLAEMDVPPAVIYTTAYSEHAVSAFEAAAQGYLLKPIRMEKLRDALQRVRKPTRAQRPREVAAPADKPLKREFILATTRDGLVRVPVQDVVYFLADQKYTTVAHLHGEVLIEESLKTLEEDLQPQFLRIHRKALVNTKFIASLDRDRHGEQHHWLKMKHAAQPLPVSRRRLAEVRRFLTEA